MEEYHFCQLQTNFIQHPARKVNSICRGNYWGSPMWISMQHINYKSIFCIRPIHEKKWEYIEIVSSTSAINRLQKTYDSFKRETFYNTLSEFVIPKKLVRPLKMCLNNTYSRVRVGKNLSDIFPINNS